MRAIVVEQTGGPEVLTLRDVPRPEPGPGQALVRVHAAGVNFIDIYHRTGLYKVDTPFTPGMEGAGVVEGTGQRVAWAMERGSYAEYAVVPEWKLVPIPDRLSFAEAAATMLQGMTAHFLTHDTWPLQQGQTAVVHAAAGGAGQLIVQFAKLRGARVVATASSTEKRELAVATGADVALDYGDLVPGVKAFTEGRGADVVYDSVGKATFEASLDCLRPRGMLVTFGQSSGPIGAIDPLVLSAKGSLFLTRPSLMHYTRNAEEVRMRAQAALEQLSVRIDREYGLEDAAQAHSDLASRRTAGKLILTI